MLTEVVKELAVILSLVSICSATKGLWGVRPSDVQLYDPSKDFRCRNGEKEIPFGKVNDDFCDCSDASDEPSTSACAHGVFYCVNAGHVGYAVPSSRVNDGVCDCCDGSDEYAKSPCENTCKDEDESDRQQVEELETEFDLPQENKPSLVHVQSREEQEKIERYERVKREHEAAAELARQLKEKTLAAERKANEILEQFREPMDLYGESPVEEKYAEEAFDALDTNQDGILHLDEVKKDETFDLNKNRVVEDREVKWYYDAMPGIANLELFKKKMWKKMGRLYVLEKEMEKALKFEFEFGETSEAPNWEEMKKEERDRQRKRQAEEAEDDDEFMNYPEDKKPFDEPTIKAVTEAVDLRRKLIEANEKLKSYQKDAEEAENNMREARTKEKEEGDGKVENDVEEENEEIREHLDNFGPEERSKYFPLRMHCFKYTDSKFLYKMCPFWGCSQEEKHSSTPTVNLGQWVGWSKEKGQPIMVFKNGAECDNGVRRSVKVRIYCGAKSLLVHVEEPKTCEYRMDFKSPAGCHIRHLKEANVTITSHDEL